MKDIIQYLPRSGNSGQISKYSVCDLETWILRLFGDTLLIAGFPEYSVEP